MNKLNGEWTKLVNESTDEWIKVLRISHMHGEHKELVLVIVVCNFQ